MSPETGRVRLASYCASLTSEKQGCAAGLTKWLLFGGGLCPLSILSFVRMA